MSYFARLGLFNQEAEQWRQWFKSQLARYDIKCFDPTVNFKINLKQPSEGIVVQNDFFLDKCNMIIVNMKMIEQSPGTMYEIFKYKWQQKPVLAFGKYEKQPHIDSAIDVWFLAKEELLDYIIAMYL